MTLRAVLADHGITGPQIFSARYGVPLDALSPAAVLTLLRQPVSPRTRDRATWTPHQRATYCAGCLTALEAIRGRLTRGLATLDTRPTVQAEVRWFTLATRALRLYTRLVDADREADTAFLASDLGAWYVALEWYEPSDEARLRDW